MQSDAQESRGDCVIQRIAQPHFIGITSHRIRSLRSSRSSLCRHLPPLQDQPSGEGSGEDQIDTLREDVEAALAEASLAQERQQLLQLEVRE